MAWIIREGEDKKRRGVQFQSLDGRDSRPAVRLGRVSEKRAQDALRYIEDLIKAKTTGSTPRTSTLEWVAGVPGKLRKRLENVGLIERQERMKVPTLGEFLKTYIKGRKDVAKGTITNYERVREDMETFFGADRLLDEITPGDAEDFRIHLGAAAGGTCRGAPWLGGASERSNSLPPPSSGR